MYTPRFTSVSAWSKAIGSSAKTHAGQRRAIIASFAPMQGSSCDRNGKRESYLCSRTRGRQERFCESHPLVLTSPPPATERDCTAGRQIVGLAELVSRVRNECAIVDGWYVTCREEAHYEERYSNSYRAKFGDTRVVDTRTVCIRRQSAAGTLETRDVAVNAWRGNYLLDALVTAGVLGADTALLSIRLHRAYSARLLRSRRALEIWERTLAGEHVDFCARRRNITFHAATEREAVAGLRRKIRARIDAKDRPVTFELCRQLGFCVEGIHSFCLAVELDPSARYSPAEIADAVAAHVADCGPYRAELLTLAKAVGYTVPAGF